MENLYVCVMRQFFQWNIPAILDKSANFEKSLNMDVYIIYNVRDGKALFIGSPKYNRKI